MIEVGRLVEYVKIEVGVDQFVYGTVREPYIIEEPVWGLDKPCRMIITSAESKQILSTQLPGNAVLHMKVRPDYYKSLILQDYLIPLSDLEILANCDKLVTLEEWN